MAKSPNKPSAITMVLSDVEALSQQLERLRNIQQDFRFPSEFSVQDAYILLYAALRTEVKRTGHKLLTTDSTSQVVSALAHYVTAKGRWVQTGFMFCGVPGNGKTSMLYALQSAIEWIRYKGLFCHAYSQYDMDNMQIVRSKQIVKIAESDGLLTSYKRKPLLGIDDLGAEPGELLNYGNVQTPMIDLIEARYNARLFTVITTNLTGAQIRQKYGARIADRLNEMMHVMIFKNDTFR